MAGTRRDGILETDDVGGGGASTNVDIVSPLGQDVAAASVPVVIASDQSPVDISLHDGGVVPLPIDSQLIYASSITNTKRALLTESVVVLRNEDGTITPWAGASGYTAFASNNYPWAKVLRSFISVTDSLLNSNGAQISIDLRERSVEAVTIFLRSSNLMGTIEFQTQPGSTSAAMQVYNTRTRRWQTGIEVNPTLDTLYMIPSAGLQTVFARITAYTSGSLLASASAGPGVSALYAEVSGSVISTKSGLTGNAPAAVAVGVGSALAVAANALRKGLILVNTAGVNTSIAFGANAAVLNAGITLVPLSTWKMDEYSFTTEAVNAISAAGPSNLAVQEFQ